MFWSSSGRLVQIHGFLSDLQLTDQINFNTLRYGIAAPPNVGVGAQKLPLQ